MVPASFPHQHTRKMPTRFTRSSDSRWGNYSQHQKGRHFSKRAFNHFCWGRVQFEKCLWTFLEYLSIGRGHIFLLLKNISSLLKSAWERLQFEEALSYLKTPVCHPQPHSLGGWDSPGQLKNHCSYPLQTYIDCTAVEKFFMPTMCMINEHPNYVSLILKWLRGLNVVPLEICVFDILAL